MEADEREYEARLVEAKKRENLLKSMSRARVVKKIVRHVVFGWFLNSSWTFLALLFFRNWTSRLEFQWKMRMRTTSYQKTSYTATKKR